MTGVSGPLVTGQRPVPRGPLLLDTQCTYFCRSILLEVAVDFLS